MRSPTRESGRESEEGRGGKGGENKEKKEKGEKEKKRQKEEKREGREEKEKEGKEDREDKEKRRRGKRRRRRRNSMRQSIIHFSFQKKNKKWKSLWRSQIEQNCHRNGRSDRSSIDVVKETISPKTKKTKKKFFFGKIFLPLKRCYLFLYVYA